MVEITLNVEPVYGESVKQRIEEKGKSPKKIVASVTIRLF